MTMNAQNANTSTANSPLDTSGGNVLTWLRFTLVFVALAGGLYPLLTTLLAGVLFPRQAQGSLLVRDGVVVGSALVGQTFTSEAYFIGRPSAADYDPTGVAGSNWGVSNPELRARAQTTSTAIAAREGVDASDIPIDLIAASASGIDPHISPAAAALQVDRVAAARGLTPTQVTALVRQHTHRNLVGLGMPHVNVLELNLALDEATP